MKTHIYLLLFFFCQIYTFAQSFKGVLLNNETKKPISQITIVSEDETFFVTSNEKGEVVLPESVLNKKLFINDYEYVYSEHTFAKKQNFVWKLTPNSETLEEIIIVKNPEIYINEIINNSIKSFVNKTKLESYYKEIFYQNNKKASEADGIADLYVNHNLENIEMVVKQSRLKEFFVLDENVKFNNSNPIETVESAMLFNLLKKIIKDKKHYEFNITAKQVANKTIHTFYINPKEDSKEKFLFKGAVVFDEDRKLILETNFYLDPARKELNTPLNYIVIKVHFAAINFHTKYMIGEQLYYPSYINRSYKGSAVMKSKNNKITRVNNQLSFYILNAEKFNSRPALSALYKFQNFFNNGNKYTVEFWKNAKVSSYVE